MELAKQIASVGGDPLEALSAGTFAPGNIGDPTAAGNTCDDANDPEGCIFTQNLLVPDATEEEILDAVGGSNPGSTTSINAGKDNSESDNSGKSGDDNTGSNDSAVNGSANGGGSGSGTQNPQSNDESVKL